MEWKSIHGDFWYGIVLMAFWAAISCSPAPETGTLGPAEQQETAMKTESPAPHSRGKIPPIDAEAPQTLHMATFGLG